MNLHTKVEELAAKGELTVDRLNDLVYEEAYVRACELDSPNSPDFASVQERIEDSLHDELFAKYLAPLLYKDEELR